MLMPKKMKHRKWHKGRSRKRQVEVRGTTVAFGSFGLQALESQWITANQIESIRKVLARYTKKGGRLWIRIFPDKPVTKKPPEVTMGSGKGAVDHYVFPVRPGRILCEVGGLSDEAARNALKMAAYKLPIRTKVVARL
jgi:large subunit ribosomal protein L16